MNALPITRLMIDAACEGDAKAITALLTTAQPDIRRYARRTCRTTSDVEDAVQEVLLLLHRRMPTLSAVASLSAWLFVVVQRLCLKMAQAAVRRTSPFDAAAHLSLASWSNEDLRIDLANAIQSLPSQYRNVVVLRDVEELTIDEIAARLEASRESVKARLHRARKLLREYLA